MATSEFEKQRWEKGMEIMRQMGRGSTMLDQKKLYPELYDISVGYLFGEIWSRPHLSIRDRELITMACNIAMARPHGTHSHYRSARHIGITHEEIMELILQCGMYAGWPAIAHAVIQYNEVLEEEAAQDKAK